MRLAPRSSFLIQAPEEPRCRGGRRQTVPNDPGKPNRGTSATSVVLRRTWRRLPAPVGSLSRWGSERGGRAARGLDLLLGGTGERVSGHRHLGADLAGAEDLDRVAVADGAPGDQVLDGDVATVGVERAQAVQVDDLELDLERVLEALELGQPHVERHLPALEARGHLVAGLGALGATAGRLALGRLTATHAGLGGL